MAKTSMKKKMRKKIDCLITKYISIHSHLHITMSKTAKPMTAAQVARIVYQGAQMQKHFDKEWQASFSSMSLGEVKAMKAVDSFTLNLALTCLDACLIKVEEHLPWNHKTVPMSCRAEFVALSSRFAPARARVFA